MFSWNPFSTFFWKTQPTDPNVSSCKTGLVGEKLKSISKFGRLETNPFPFKIKMFWDNEASDSTDTQLTHRNEMAEICSWDTGECDSKK